MAPNRRQAIIWTNVNRFSDAYMRHGGGGGGGYILEQKKFHKIQS